MLRAEGHLGEVDVLTYLTSFDEDYICADGLLYRYNGFYWEQIDCEYVYSLLSFVYLKSREYIMSDAYADETSPSALDDERKIDLKRVGTFKRRAFLKSTYEYMRERYSKLVNPFDKNVSLLGFTNGTYELESGVFREPRKSDFVSMVLPFEYKPSSEEDMGVVMAYLGKIMPDKAERELLLLLLSTCLSGHVLDRFIVCTGLGSNGKDALFSYLLKAALGPFYYRGSSISLTQPARSDLNVGLANMHMKRAVIFNEPSTQCLIQCSLVKELTGGCEINARGLYSSKSSVVLHQTMWMLCNDKPLLDKVDEAIARRLITFNFRSLFKSEEWLLEHKLSDGENNVYLGDESVKFEPFLKKYRLPFINVLLPYFLRYVNNKYVLTGIPESVQKESRKYMEESDLLYSWFNGTYEKTSNKEDRLKLKTVYSELKESEYYCNLTKAEKRKLSYNALIEYIERSPLLRMFYKERIEVKKDNEPGYTTFKNVLTNYKLRSCNEH